MTRRQLHTLPGFLRGRIPGERTGVSEHGCDSGTVVSGTER